MSLTSVCVDPPLAVRLAQMLLVAYPIVVLLQMRSREPMSASAVPLILSATFVGLTAGWLTVAHVVQGISITSGGRHATAAGLAEVLDVVAFSLAISAFVAGVAWLRDFVGTRQPEEQRRASNAAKMMATGFAGLALASSIALIVIARGLLTDPRWQVSFSLLVGVAIVLLLAALASFIWLILSRRMPALQFHTARRSVSLTCAIVCVALWWSVSHVAKEFEAISRWVNPQ